MGEGESDKGGGEGEREREGGEGESETTESEGDGEGERGSESNDAVAKEGAGVLGKADESPRAGAMGPGRQRLVATVEVVAGNKGRGVGAGAGAGWGARAVGGGPTWKGRESGSSAVSSAGVVVLDKDKCLWRW